MESRYTVQISAFEGPLDLLLQLIEKEKLSISEISLASVTDQFLCYVESREKVPLAELSHFLNIAAKLILIKSRSLLPTLSFSQNEESSVEDLQMQLEIYALFKQVGKSIELQLKKKNYFPVRDHYLNLEKSYFPPNNVDRETVKGAFQEFLGQVEIQSDPLPEKTLKKIISLEQRIADIQKTLQERGKIAFSQMLKEGAPIEERIVCFLALLELIKQKFIFVQQAGHFEEINIQKI